MVYFGAYLFLKHILCDFEYDSDLMCVYRRHTSYNECHVILCSHKNYFLHFVNDTLYRGKVFYTDIVEDNGFCILCYVPIFCTMNLLLRN